MFRFFKYFFKSEEVDEEDNTLEEEFCLISYHCFNNGNVVIDYNFREKDFNIEFFAKFVSYISSVSGQLDLLKQLEKGLQEEGKTELYDSFLGHFLTIKAKEMSSDGKKFEDEPCISPSEML